MKCKNCFNYRNEWCELVVDSPHPDIERDCKHFRELTNADRIRAMSDEELAAMLDAFCEAAECRTADEAVCPFYDKCPHDETIGINNAWAVWLQQPCEGGAE